MIRRSESFLSQVTLLSGNFDSADAFEPSSLLQIVSLCPQF
ncbi:MAG: hypothetical protein RMI34_09215 [Chloroherpetonaceae bacterium]|nr:hypothetical protein [Chloroherpetonaceae bacterium]MCS7211845.1 hypothetical protein [Chloroherpetonaceae bacterium]MDW8020239.1 hypothetical protein [Chloroherpetonaceae bacterium]